MLIDFIESATKHNTHQWRKFSDAPRKRALAKLDWQAEVMQGAKRVVGRRAADCSAYSATKFNTHQWRNWQTR